MIRIRIKPWFVGLAGYLAAILCFPAGSPGAPLQSEPAGREIPGFSEAISRLGRLGLGTGEAGRRLSSLQPEELRMLASGKWDPLIGTGVQYPSQDNINEVSYVLIIVVVICGAAAYAVFRMQAGE